MPPKERKLGIMHIVNSLMPRRNRRDFADDILRCNFLEWKNKNFLNISLKSIPKGRFGNIPALV